MVNKNIDNLRSDYDFANLPYSLSNLATVKAAIRTANLKRKNDDDDEIEVTPAKRKNIKIRIKSSKRNRRKPIRRSVFDDDDE